MLQGIAAELNPGVSGPAGAGAVAGLTGARRGAMSLAGPWQAATAGFFA
jgi:hypothetical protein